MNRFGPEVAASIAAARERGAKVSIFDDQGCLLWFCEAWEDEVGMMERWKQALGWGWLEFIHEEDVAVVRAWIQAGDGAAVEFRSVQAEHPDRWQEVRLVKRRVGLYWLAVGARRLLDERGGVALTLVLLASASMGEVVQWAAVRGIVGKVIGGGCATMAGPT